MRSELPSPDALAKDILEFLKLDDCKFLHEIVWDLQTKCPGVGSDETISLAREVLRQMLDHGQIELLRGDWPPGPVFPLREGDFELLKERTQPWDNPGHSEIMVFISIPGTKTIMGRPRANSPVGLLTSGP
jgi:hypothetical protein